MASARKDQNPKALAGRGGDGATGDRSNGKLNESVTESSGILFQQAEAGLRAYSIAPGVVDTAMQERVRACGPEEFPDVERFLQMKADDAFNAADFVARHFLAIAFDPEARPDSVAIRLPFEGG